MTAMTGSVVTWEDAADGVLVATMDHRPANALGPPIIDGLNRLVEAGEARTAAVALARRLAELSRPALAAVVRTVDAAFDQPLAAGREFEIEQIQGLFEHGEAREGIAAFLEKRASKFG